MLVMREKRILLITSTTFFYRKTRNFPQVKKLLFYAAKRFKPLIMSWVQRTLS